MDIIYKNKKERKKITKKWGLAMLVYIVLLSVLPIELSWVAMSLFCIGMIVFPDFMVSFVKLMDEDE